MVVGQLCVRFELSGVVYILLHPSPTPLHRTIAGADSATIMLTSIDGESLVALDDEAVRRKYA